MNGLWRFFDGQINGVVVALTEEEAKKRASAYLKTHFDGYEESAGMKVWPFAMDDDYDMDAPWALAVSY